MSGAPAVPMVIYPGMGMMGPMNSLTAMHTSGVLSRFEPSQYELDMAVHKIMGAKTEKEAAKAAAHVHRLGVDMSDTVIQALEEKIAYLRNPGWSIHSPPPMPMGFHPMHLIMHAYNELHNEASAKLAAATKPAAPAAAPAPAPRAPPAAAPAPPPRKPMPQRKLRQRPPAPRPSPRRQTSKRNPTPSARPARPQGLRPRPPPRNAPVTNRSPPKPRRQNQARQRQRQAGRLPIAPRQQPPRPQRRMPPSARPSARPRQGTPRSNGGPVNALPRQGKIYKLFP